MNDIRQAAGYAGDPGESRVMPLFTPEQAAEILQCKPSWIRDKARRREIPFTMIAGQYRLSDAHLTEIVAMNEQRPETAVPPRAVRRRSGADEQPAPAVSLQARRPQRARRSA